MICAGVLAAKTSGIALGQRLTSHPSVKGELEKREFPKARERLGA